MWTSIQTSTGWFWALAVGLTAGVICSPATARAVCGDGIIDPAEHCDDGNAEARGWCAADCQSTAGPTQYVLALGSDVIRVVDIATHVVVATIPLPNGYASRIVASPSGDYAAVFGSTSSFGDAIWLVDLVGLNMVAMFTLSNYSSSDQNRVAFSHDSKTLYVINDDEEIVVIDVQSRTEVRRISRLPSLDNLVCPGDSYHGPESRSDLVISRDGYFAYEATSDDSYLIASDLREGGAPRCLALGSYDSEDSQQIPDADNPRLALSSDGKSIYFAGDYSDTWFSRLDLQSEKFSTIYEEYTHAHSIAVGCSGTIFVTRHPDDGLQFSTVDPKSLAVVQAPEVPSSASFDRQSVTRDEQTLFWATGSRVAWWDTKTHVEGEIVFEGGAFDLALVVVPSRTEPLCAPNVQNTCNVSFLKGSLFIDERSPGSEKWVAKMSGGPVGQEELGNPINPPCGNTKYALCVYDDHGSLAGQLTIDRAGGRCSARNSECWRRIGADSRSAKGYNYSDVDGATVGVNKVRLRNGPSGKLFLKADNDGGQLPLGIAESLNGSSSATLQFVTSDAGCFSIDLNRVKRADGQVFRASR